MFNNTLKILLIVLSISVHIQAGADDMDITKELAKFDTLPAVERNSAISKYLKNLSNSKKYKTVLDAASLILNDGKSSMKVKSWACHYAYYACIRLRDYLRAAEWGEKLEELNKPGGYWHSKGLIFQASALTSQGKFQKAIAVFPESAIKKMGSLQSEAYRTSGEIYKAMKKYQKATEEYQKAVDVTKNPALKSVGYLRKGIVLQDAGKDAEALKEYTNVCKYEHPYYKGNAIVNALRLLKNKPQDSMIWIEMLDNDKKITPYWRSRGLMYAGMRLKELGKNNAAKKKLQEAVALKGTSAWIKKLVLKN